MNRFIQRIKDRRVDLIILSVICIAAIYFISGEIRDWQENKGFLIEQARNNMMKDDLRRYGSYDSVRIIFYEGDTIKQEVRGYDTTAR